MAACLAIVGLVCLTQASKIEFGPGGLTRYATARIEGAEAAITIYTDNLNDLDPSAMHRACAGDACVIYHKACETQARRISCRYSLAGMRYHPALTLTAPDRRALARAERLIAILADRDRPQGAVPLTALSEESASPYPPYCRSAGRGRICPPGVVRD